MIVDVHTHVFPPAMVERREQLARGDSSFAELYGDRAARMATATELVASMDEAGVDVAVAAGFAWRDGEHCAEHAAYLLEAAASSGGRLLPFVPLPAEIADAEALARDRGAAWKAGGACGLGEVRVAGDESEAVDRLAAIAEELDLPLLAHVSEGVGHTYPGKGGGLSVAALWRLIERHEVRVIAAHWGGGFPFFALMPEVRAELERGRVLFDTAASPLLYEPRIFDVAHALGLDTLVGWGSDFPLRGQERDRVAVEEAVGDIGRRAAILGGNAARFLGLE